MVRQTNLYEFSLEYIRCVRCKSKIELETLSKSNQIDEGFLFCQKCNLLFPIIQKIPILWDDFTNYLFNRPKLGGELLINSKTTKMRSFIKQTLGKIKQNPNDQSIIEKRWSDIYLFNKKSNFYSKIKTIIKNTKSDLALEHGCSIGTLSEHLAKYSSLVFGIDKSYYSILMAKKTHLGNLDFFVADSVFSPFGNTQFDTVVGLNLFELIEPKYFLKLISKQVKRNGSLILTDPYDYDRGTKSVKEPLDETQIRKEITKNHFIVSKNTEKPSYLLWNLKLYHRARLQYKVDLIIAKKL